MSSLPLRMSTHSTKKASSIQQGKDTTSAGHGWLKTLGTKTTSTEPKSQRNQVLNDLETNSKVVSVKRARWQIKISSQVHSGRNCDKIVNVLSDLQHNGTALGLDQYPDAADRLPIQTISGGHCSPFKHRNNRNQVGKWCIKVTTKLSWRRKYTNISWTALKVRVLIHYMVLYMH
jgi:hypothetical protein